MIRILLMSFLFVLAACSTTVNTPKQSQVANTPRKDVSTLWANDISNQAIALDDQLRPVFANGVIYTAASDGTVSAVNAITGQILWQISIKTPISAGPAVASNKLVVNTREAHVVALDVKTGKQDWQATLFSELLAPPVISNNMVLVKSLNGQLATLDLNTGAILWLYNHGAPEFIMRLSSAPAVQNNTVIAGFADGRLDAIQLSLGSVLWQTRLDHVNNMYEESSMSAIDGTPAIAHGVVYASANNGYLAAIDLKRGKILWRKKLTTNQGITLGQNMLFVVDTTGTVWAMQQSDGGVLWRQPRFAGLNLTQPVLTSDLLVLGDSAGYLDLLAIDDGHLIKRISVGSSAIIGRPLVQGRRVVALNSSGKLKAYRV